MDRTNPITEPRKSLKAGGFRRNSLVFENGKPRIRSAQGRYSRNKSGDGEKPFEFNDILEYIKVDSSYTGKTRAVFRSLKYDTEVKMRFRDFNNIVRFMYGGFLKARLCWLEIIQAGEMVVVPVETY